MTDWECSASEALQVGRGWTLNDLDLDSTPGFTGGEKAGSAQLDERGEVLSSLQEKLFANGRSGDRRSILLVLQGMDTAGKGGIVRHVIGHADPQGIDHASFGKPTPEELRHHYLWRIRKQLPRAGQIGVFDRSHYEDVLIVRVRELVPLDVVESRYDEINEFERELVEAGTTIIKVALFVSLDEQKARLAERLARPDKYWKYNPGDIDERKLWPKYQQAYQIAIERTSTDIAPWHVIPANRKWFARLAVTELLISALDRLQLDWPPADFDVEVEKQRLADC